MKLKRVFSAITTVVAVLVFLVALLLMILTLMLRDGRTTVFGYELRLVQTSSMEPSVHAGDVLFIKTSAGTADLSVGDVITFLYDGVYGPTVITHRIVGITEDGDGRVFTVRGDAAEETETQEVRPNAIVGKVTYTAHVLGAIVRVLRNPVGMTLCVIVPSAVIIAAELSRIIIICKKRRNRSAEKS